MHEIGPVTRDAIDQLQENFFNSIGAVQVDSTGENRVLRTKKTMKDLPEMLLECRWKPTTSQILRREMSRNLSTDWQIDEKIPTTPIV
jgi:tRNA C32,U32 (ribose-2'-O)-methylase TrmJ